jgi:hypothetical protein
MNLIGGFSFGLIIGYLTWHVARPGEPNTELNIKNLLGIIGALGGAVVLTLFPAGSDLFSIYSVGLAVGFFLTSILQGIKNWYFSILQEKARKESIQKANEQKEKDDAQDDFIYADFYIDKNLDILIKVIGQKFIDNPNLDLVARNLPEFPVPILVKIQILRFFAIAMPNVFHYGVENHGLQMHREYRTKNISFLANPKKVRTKIKHILPYKT